MAFASTLLVPLKVSGQRGYRRELSVSSRNRRVIVRSSLRDWAIENGTKVSDCLEVKPNSMVVTRKVMKGTELVTLPLDLALMELEKRDKEVDADVALAIKLINGKELEWIKSMPSPNSAFLWNDEELQYLKGSNVYERANETRGELQEEWETHRDVCSLEEFLTAIAKVRAYGLKLATKKTVLAPFLTKANVKEDDSNCIIQEKGGFFGKKTLSLITNKPMDNNDEISVPRFGSPLDCATSLLEVGKLNENYSFSVTLTISKMDKFFEDKELILEQQDLNTVETFILYKGEVVPDEFLAYLRLMCLQTSDAFLLEPIFSSQVWDFMKLPVSKDNEENACKFVIGACDDALDGYDENESNGDGNIRKQMAMKLIDGEKSVIKQCRGWFERRSMQLDEMQYYQERRLDELDLLRPLDESEIIDDGSGIRLGRAFDQGM